MLSPAARMLGATLAKADLFVEADAFSPELELRPESAASSTTQVVGTENGAAVPGLKPRSQQKADGAWAAPGDEAAPSSSGAQQTAEGSKQQQQQQQAALPEPTLQQQPPAAACAAEAAADPAPPGAETAE